MENCKNADDQNTGLEMRVTQPCAARKVTPAAPRMVPGLNTRIAKALVESAYACCSRGKHDHFATSSIQLASYCNGLTGQARKKIHFSFPIEMVFLVFVLEHG